MEDADIKKLAFSISF